MQKQNLDLKSYGKARSLMIVADSGGRNGSRVRLWKWELQQFALMTEDLVSSATEVAGTSGVVVLGVTATHRDRAGESPAELTNLELLLEDEEGEPLSEFHANELIERVYLDNNSGVFESGSDTLGATMEDLSSGTQTIIFDFKPPTRYFKGPKRPCWAGGH